MLALELTRWAYTPFGTFGTLRIVPTVSPRAECWTLEEVWDDNHAGCIPTGAYICQPTFFFKKNYATWEVLNVPGRERILLHVGNTAADTEGCILVGAGLGFIRSSWAVVDSQWQFEKFMALLEGETRLPLSIADSLKTQWPKDQGRITV